MKPKKEELKFTTSKREAICADMNQFCYLSKEHDFIEITRWTNWDGYDITIGGSSEVKQFSLTSGEVDAIKALVKKLNKL